MGLFKTTFTHRVRVYTEYTITSGREMNLPLYLYFMYQLEIINIILEVQK